MGKIFEALEKSNIEYTQPELSPATADEIIQPDAAPQAESERFTVGQSDCCFDQNRIDKGLVTLLKPYSYEVEQFKKLRTNILFPEKGEAPRSILVTSAVPGEGKSFVAANLSVSIAQNVDKNVLLMDCDMRKPCLHTRFGFNGMPGLSEYLAKGHKLDGLLARTVAERLTLLPSGVPPDNPSELLSSKRMADLLSEEMARYRDRYLIIDAPPPHMCAETAAIARQVDGILVVVKCGSTPKEAIADLTDLLGKENIIGVVFNRFDAKFSKYGYGGYNKYHEKK